MLSQFAHAYSLNLSNAWEHHSRVLAMQQQQQQQQQKRCSD